MQSTAWLKASAFFLCQIVIAETEKPANEFSTCMILILRCIYPKDPLQTIILAYQTPKELMPKHMPVQRFSCRFPHISIDFCSKHNSKCFCFYKTMYHQVFNIRRTKSQHSQDSRTVLRVCRIPWSQMLSLEWRYSWSSADKIKDFIVNSP